MVEMLTLSLQMSLNATQLNPIQDRTVYPLTKLLSISRSLLNSPQNCSQIHFYSPCLPSSPMFNCSMMASAVIWVGHSSAPWMLCFHCSFMISSGLHLKVMLDFNRQRNTHFARYFLKRKKKECLHCPAPCPRATLIKATVN